MKKTPKTPKPFNAADYTDRTGTWRVPQGISILIRCIDARRSYGRLELLITPIGGGGEAWVQAAYVTLHEPGEDSLTRELIARWSKKGPTNISVEPKNPC